MPNTVYRQKHFHSIHRTISNSIIVSLLQLEDSALKMFSSEDNAAPEGWRVSVCLFVKYQTFLTPSTKQHIGTYINIHLVVYHPSLVASKLPLECCSTPFFGDFHGRCLLRGYRANTFTGQSEAPAHTGKCTADSPCSLAPRYHRP